MYSTVPGIGKTRVIGRPLGLLISDIGSPPRRWDQQIVWHAHHRSTRWHCNLMWLGALERLVLFVQPLLLMVLLVSFGKTASSTLVGDPASTLLEPLGSTSVGGGSTKPRGSAGPPCARWSPSHTHEHFNLVSAFVAHLSPENIRSESRSRGCHLPLTSPTTLHIPTWFEVSTCEVLDLARARTLQTEKSHFASSSGTVDSSRSSHPHLVEDVPTAKRRVGSPIAQLDDPLVFPHHTSLPDIA